MIANVRGTRFPGVAQRHQRLYARLRRAMAVRCRPGIATNSKLVTIPDQRCSADAPHRVRETLW
jgi:hypothetical protein